MLRKERKSRIQDSSGNRGNLKLLKELGEKERGRERE